MIEKRAFVKRFKSDPITHLIAIFALVIGLMFIFTQTSKPLHPEAAETEMQSLPIGLFDWGFAWADTLVIVPMLLFGGLCLLRGSYRLGHLLTFAGWTVNLYDAILFVVGFKALGEPLVGADLVGFIITTAFLPLLCMIWSAVIIIRESPMN